MPDNNQQLSGGAAPPSSGESEIIRPTYTAQRFLSVHVPKGSSQAQIADAVSKALRSQNVPYFKDRIASSAAVPTTTSAPQEAAPASVQVELQAGGANANVDDSDGLLILVQQEGGP